MLCLILGALGGGGWGGRSRGIMPIKLDYDPVHFHRILVYFDLYFWHKDFAVLSVQLIEFNCILFYKLAASVLKLPLLVYVVVLFPKMLHMKKFN